MLVLVSCYWGYIFIYILWSVIDGCYISYVHSTDSSDIHLTLSITHKGARRNSKQRKPETKRRNTFALYRRAPRTKYNQIRKGAHTIAEPFWWPMAFGDGARVVTDPFDAIARINSLLAMWTHNRRTAGARERRTDQEQKAHNRHPARDRTTKHSHRHDLCCVVCALIPQPPGNQQQTTVLRVRVLCARVCAVRACVGGVGDGVVKMIELKMLNAEDVQGARSRMCERARRACVA